MPTDQLIADLRARREALGISQATLAERCGANPVAISHIETGYRRPSLELLGKIADALGVEVRAIPRSLDDDVREMLDEVARAVDRDQQGDDDGPHAA